MCSSDTFTPGMYGMFKNTMNQLLTYDVRTGLLLPDASACTYKYKRLGEKYCGGANFVNLSPGFFLHNSIIQGSHIILA